MKVIKKGAQGAAVEDIQRRLMALGFDIGSEKIDASFGSATAQALLEFRRMHGLEEKAEVDQACWSLLVDESFKLGDRALYLRMPNFHGNDVKTLQGALNALGFSCGNLDGIFGRHTENALKEFQTNIGLSPDGIAFDATFAAIERLRHIWSAKSPQTHEGAHMGLARTLDVLEKHSICVVGLDQISRNVASRIWNIALATTENSRLTLLNTYNDTELPHHIDAVIVLAAHDDVFPDNAAKISLDTPQKMAQRMQNALDAQAHTIITPYKMHHHDVLKVPHMCVLLRELNYYDGSVTARHAQSAATCILDALCQVFSENNKA